MLDDPFESPTQRLPSMKQLDEAMGRSTCKEKPTNAMRMLKVLPCRVQESRLHADLNAYCHETLPSWMHSQILLKTMKKLY